MTEVGQKFYANDLHARICRFSHHFGKSNIIIGYKKKKPRQVEASKKLF
jgi:hypothetical protein